MSTKTPASKKVTTHVKQASARLGAALDLVRGVETAAPTKKMKEKFGYSLDVDLLFNNLRSLGYKEEGPFGKAENFFDFQKKIPNGVLGSTISALEKLLTKSGFKVVAGGAVWGSDFAGIVPEIIPGKITLKITVDEKAIN